MGREEVWSEGVNVPKINSIFGPQLIDFDCKIGLKIKSIRVIFSQEQEEVFVSWPEHVFASSSWWFWWTFIWQCAKTLCHVNYSSYVSLSSFHSALNDLSGLDWSPPTNDWMKESCLQTHFDERGLCGSGRENISTQQCHISDKWLSNWTLGTMGQSQLFSWRAEIGKFFLNFRYT